MSSSNLSKIKPKLRTQGAVTGNFGAPKTKAGSPLREIGETQAETVHITPREMYISRMVGLLDNPRMRVFAQGELHRLGYYKQHRLAPQGRVCAPYRVPGT
jgi:hypothetical protein